MTDQIAVLVVVSAPLVVIVLVAVGAVVVGSLSSRVERKRRGG
jgi:hypothetical protein